MGRITRLRELDIKDLKDKDLFLDSPIEITGWLKHDDDTVTVHVVDVQGNEIPIRLAGHTLVFITETPTKED